MSRFISLNRNLRDEILLYLSYFEQTKIRLLNKKFRYDTKLNMRDFLHVLQNFCKINIILYFSTEKFMGYNLNPLISLATRKAEEVSMGDLVSAFVCYLQCVAAESGCYILSWNMHSLEVDDVPIVELIVKELSLLNFHFCLDFEMSSSSLVKFTSLLNSIKSVSFKEIKNTYHIYALTNCDIRLNFKEIFCSAMSVEDCLEYFKKYPDSTRHIINDMPIGTSYRGYFLDVIKLNRNTLEKVTVIAQNFDLIQSITEISDKIVFVLDLQKSNNKCIESMNIIPSNVVTNRVIEIINAELSFYEVRTLVQTFNNFKQLRRVSVLFGYTYVFENIQNFFDGLELPHLEYLSVIFNQQFVMTRSSCFATTLRKFDKLTTLYIYSYNNKSSHIPYLYIPFVLNICYEDLFDMELVLGVLKRSQVPEFKISNLSNEKVAELLKYFYGLKEYLLVSKIKYISLHYRNNLCQIELLHLKELDINGVVNDFNSFCGIRRIDKLCCKRMLRLTEEMAEFIREKKVQHLVIGTLEAKRQVSNIICTILEIKSLMSCIITSPVKACVINKAALSSLKKNTLMSFEIKICQLSKENWQEFDNIDGVCYT